MYKTYQEAFDQTIDKLVAQGNFGYDYEDETCLYETHEGNRCAVGINLSENTLDRIKNTNNINSRLYAIWGMLSDELRITDELIITDDHDRDFIFWKSLQEVHDGWAENYVFGVNPLNVLKESFNIDTSKASLLQDMARRIEDARE